MVKALDSGDVPALPPPRPLTMQNQAMPATGGYRAPAVQDPMGDYVPTAADIERWNAPEVVRFRRKVTPFMFVGGACMVLALVSDTNFMGMWGLYGVYLAYQYARLWSDGYDWHDVFRQPRDRIFTDVMAERLDEVQAMWDTRKRGIVRERHRRTLGQPSMFSPVPQMGLSGGPSSMSAADAGALGSGQNAAVARQAIVDREEIARLLESLSKSDRARFPDVIPTAQSLAQKVLALATALTELERASGADSAEKIDKEISLLESQANPLDRVASEERVRRLALLKRQRRTVADVGRRKAELQGKIESCSLMLENLKLDLLRFKTGQQPWQTVTSVTERAQSLARDVDNAVYVADEMNRLSPRGGGGRTRADTDRP
jgi:serine/threonine-protein kinase